MQLLSFIGEYPDGENGDDKMNDILLSVGLGLAIALVYLVKGDGSHGLRAINLVGETGKGLAIIDNSSMSQNALGMLKFNYNICNVTKKATKTFWSLAL